MNVSQESTEQTDKRLREVFAACTLTWHDGAFGFYEYPRHDFPMHEADRSLALVRDDDVWSVLKRADSSAVEEFGIFSFHFPDGMDNSGFVGWLASRLKRELGTGVFVVCGRNSTKGGIFDYWGVPFAMVDDTKKVLSDLR